MRETGSGGVKRYMRRMKGGDDDESDEMRMSDARTRQVHEMVLSLVIGPPNEKHEAKVDFAKSMVRPRRLKTWVTELADTVRDFFWSALASFLVGKFAHKLWHHSGSSVTRAIRSGMRQGSIRMLSRRPRSRLVRPEASSLKPWHTVCVFPPLSPFPS